MLVSTVIISIKITDILFRRVVHAPYVTLSLVFASTSVSTLLSGTEVLSDTVLSPATNVIALSDRLGTGD